MKTISDKKFCRVLERHGWSHLRQNGSHHIYGKEGVPARISVPVHGTRPLKKGLLRHFMTIAELSDSDLE